MSNDIELDITAEYALNLSLIEVGVGSLVHAINIPFSGHLLSINQGLLLTHVSRILLNHSLGGVKACANISTISALFKSLSPAGKKLGPMLSISVQGFLFSVGLFLGGSSFLGVILGMSLLCCWAFIQPSITLYIFFGHNLITAVEFYANKVEDSLAIPVESQLSFVLAIIVTKMILGSSLAVLIFRQNRDAFLYHPPAWTAKSIIKRHNDSTLGNILKSSFKDLFNPLFLMSFSFMMVFFLFNQNSSSEVIWLSFRPIAIAFLFFFLSRHPFIYKFLNNLRGKGMFKKQFLIFDKAKEKLYKK